MGILGPSLFKCVSTPGHWLQLEARDEVNAILKEFFEKYGDEA
jgi:pimeloyl-ACP methyl ester carboxylesterase